MAKNSVIEGPCESSGKSLTPSGSHTTNGEPGFKKRTGGRFPEVVRDLNSRLPKATKG